MSIFKKLRNLVGVGAIALASTAAHATPGCVGQMWNPLADMDFRLMGGISIAGIKMMEDPKALGAPPNSKTKTLCFCKDSLQTGMGLGLSFWLPAYINDVARQAGCIGFLDGLNILPGFMSQSSGQEYSQHRPGVEGTTSMQIHWAYADITAIAGKQLFERCDTQTGAMSISYMTEPDFVFQSDVYSVIMTPHASIIASSPILAMMACGAESVANTLGDWQDWGVCAWNGSRLPLSGTSISKNSAQVTNMDVTVKYLTRSALMGATLRTMGHDAICGPQYSPFYDPFQHRYQWSFPGKVSTRYNVDVMRWGMFIKDQGQGNLLNLTSEAASLGGVSATVEVGSANPDLSASSPTTQQLGLAERIVKQLPKPLNFPTKEAGYMQVWEYRQCCMMIFTIENLIKMIVENLATMGGGMAKMLYDIYNVADTAYKVIQDPIGAALGFVGDQLAGMLDWIGESSGVMGSLDNIANGVSKSLGSLTG